MNSRSMNARPELLMPAGTLAKLMVAYEYGADAVYAGAPFFSLRARENEFSMDALAEGIQIARTLGKKLYVTANVFARNLKIKPFDRALDDILSLKPDALIMSDPGFIDMVRERSPHQAIHLSVQANCMNWRSVRFWQKQGISRIILSRELRLAEIKEIRNQVPDMELEAFVHGSVCIAYSGRCLLSHYMSRRDANQGVCDNSCRFPFKVYERDQQTDAEKEYVLEDLRTPGEFYPIDEDENGTYIMNAKDLCLIENLKDIADSGVCSFKVEGRTKSDFYVALVTACYRRAIDDMVAGRPFDRSLLDLLLGSAHRGFTKGFLAGVDSAELQNYQPTDRPAMSPYVGRVTSDVTSPDGRQTMDVRGTLRRDQVLRVLSPKGVEGRRVLNLWSASRREVEILHPGQSACGVELDAPVPTGSYLMS